MPRRLTYTQTARDDLAGVRLWLTQLGSGPVARQRLAAIRVDAENLRQHPCLYPLGRHPGVRGRPCTGGYRVLHEIDPDTGRDGTAGDVRVLRVFGPGQDRGAL